MRVLISKNLTRICILVLFLIVLLNPTQSILSASTYIVNNNGDAGDAHPGDNICRTSVGTCTLRAAMQEANMHTGLSTINIPAMTIIVHSQLSMASTNTDSRGVIINGAGQNSTIIDGNNQTRVFYFAKHSGLYHSISNLTIRNAKNTQTEVVRQRNGGGIYNEGGLVLRNVTLTRNLAYQGGGVYQHRPDIPAGYYPKLTLDNVTISYNTATSAVLGAGGGGIANGSIVTGNKVNILSNKANYMAGGFYNNSYQQVTLTNFSISNNSAFLGGGVYDDIGPMTFSSGKINGNLALCCLPVYPDGSKHHSGGAGIATNGNSTVVKSRVIIKNVQIASNQVLEKYGMGGGILNIAQMELTNVSITGNKATYGAGIYNGLTSGITNLLSTINTTISSNIGPDTSAAGGGIFNRGNLKLIHDTIYNNSAVVGGGLDYRGASITIYNTILSGNISRANLSPNCRTDPGKTITSGGYNIIGSRVGCSFPLKTGDQSTNNPSLLALTGFPPYHPLTSTSVAVNRGTNTGCPPTDIRGAVRPYNGICDVGAYEYHP